MRAICDSGWSFAVGQLDEDRAIPDGWMLRFEQDHAYSGRLVIDTGDELVEVSRSGTPEAKPIGYAFREVQGRPVGRRFCDARSSIAMGSSRPDGTVAFIRHC